MQLTAYDRYRTGTLLFKHWQYADAAREFESLLGEDAPAYGLGDARQLLARSYYHSAQLGRAERAARDLLERDASDGYAALLLARTLKRQGRGEEAEPWFTRAAALGETA